MSDLTGDKNGLKTALREEHDPSAPPPGTVAAHQLPLLPLITDNDASADGAEPGSPQRGAGRPPGSKNKSTEEWRTYLLSRYSSPLVAMAETFNRSLHQLAVDLGYLVIDENGKPKLDDAGQPVRVPKPEEMLELFKVQMQCAKELAPYVHQKQPMAIEAGEKGLVSLIIQTGMATQQQVDQAGTFSMNFLDSEIQQNQAVTDAENSKSVAAESVTTPKALEHNSEPQEGN